MRQRLSKHRSMLNKDGYRLQWSKSHRAPGSDDMVSMVMCFCMMWNVTDGKVCWRCVVGMTGCLTTDLMINDQNRE